MATLTTSQQLIGKNESGTIHTYLYGWYSNQSGNTCTVHLKLTVVSSGITYTGTNKTYSISLGGYNSGTQSWSYAPLNANTEYTVAEVTWTYSGGEAISASAGFWSYVYGNADVGLTETTSVPTFASAPTGLSVTVAEVYETGAKFNVSVSSYGNPASASGRYLEAGFGTKNVWTTPLRSATQANTSSAQITVNNNSTGQTSLIIRPNTQYYYGGYAWNTQIESTRMFGQLVTKIRSPQFAFEGREGSVATIRYTTDADGGYYNKTIQYSIDNGTTWLTGAILTGGAAKSGTFEITGLVADQDYVVLTRTTTPAWTIPGPDIALNSETIKLYGSVNDSSVQVRDLYGADTTQGSDNQHPIVPIDKLYASVGGESKLIYQGFGHIKYN